MKDYGASFGYSLVLVTYRGGQIVCRFFRPTSYPVRKLRPSSWYSLVRWRLRCIPDHCLTSLRSQAPFQSPALSNPTNGLRSRDTAPCPGTCMARDENPGPIIVCDHAAVGPHSPINPVMQLDIRSLRRSSGNLQGQQPYFQRSISSHRTLGQMLLHQ